MDIRFTFGSLLMNDGGELVLMVGMFAAQEITQIRFDYCEMVKRINTGHLEQVTRQASFSKTFTQDLRPLETH